MLEHKSIKVEKICPQCGETKTVHMTEAEFHSLTCYNNGEGLIQDMLPDIPRPERELLRGGMCGECWIKMFGPPPEEETDDMEEVIANK